MKIGFKEFLELNVNELIAVNGGGSGSCSGSSGDNTGSGNSNSYTRDDSCPGLHVITYGNGNESNTKTSCNGSASSSGSCSGGSTGKGTSAGKEYSTGNGSGDSCGGGTYTGTTGSCGGINDKKTGGVPSGKTSGKSTAGTCAGTTGSNTTSGSWGQITNTYADDLTMQEYKDTPTDNSMNGGNTYSKSGCLMTGTAKLLTQITGIDFDEVKVNQSYDTNTDGLMSEDEITSAIRANLTSGKQVQSDCFESTLTKQTLDSIAGSSDGTTYMLGRAEDVQGGQHWVVLEGYSTNSRGQVQFTYDGTSSNDAGRIYILGTPQSGQTNTYRISKIETYTIR